MRVAFSDQNTLIRPYCPEDIPRMFEAARESIAELAPWMSWCHPNYSFEECASWVNAREAEWNNGEHYSFAIMDAVSERFCGGVGLNFINRVHHFCNLGYWVRSSATGRGIATTATRLAAQFGLRELHLKRIEIIVALENLASQRVAVKAGALHEGVLRSRLSLHDVVHDAAMYSFVAADLRT